MDLFIGIVFANFQMKQETDISSFTQDQIKWQHIQKKIIREEPHSIIIQKNKSKIYYYYIFILMLFKRQQEETNHPISALELLQEIHLHGLCA